MTLLRKLAIVFAFSLFVVLLTLGYDGEHQTIAQYIRGTFRVVGTFAVTAWFVVWRFSSDYQE